MYPIFIFELKYKSIPVYVKNTKVLTSLYHKELLTLNMFSKNKTN